MNSNKVIMSQAFIDTFVQLLLNRDNQNNKSIGQTNIEYELDPIRQSRQVSQKGSNKKKSKRSKKRSRK